MYYRRDQEERSWGEIGKRSKSSSCRGSNSGPGQCQIVRARKYFLGLEGVTQVDKDYIVVRLEDMHRAGGKFTNKDILLIVP